MNGMTYREEVLRTTNGVLSERDLLINGALGLGGESGEVLDIIKKHLFHGAILDKTNLINELGDCRFYMELICFLNGITMDEVEQANTTKLRKRFPNGFSHEAAQAKADLK